MAQRLLVGGFATLFAAGVGYKFAVKSEDDGDDRIRADGYTAKQKFDKYATQRSGDESVMTPKDFMRSMCVDAEQDPPPLASDKMTQIFRFVDADGNGVLDFQEYCLYATLLANSMENFRIAFKMFDIDGNGHVDAKEFEQIVRSMVRDPTAKLDFQGGLMVKFFGPQLNKELTFQQFSTILNSIRTDVRKAEFSQFVNDRSAKITMADMRRLIYGSDAIVHDDDKTLYVPFSTYNTFLDLLLNAETISRALDMYEASTGEICKSDFVRAVRCVGVNLPSRDADVIFNIFDLDGSGSVTSEEFTEVAEARKRFFVSQPPDFDEPKRNAMQQFAYCMQQKK